MAQANLVQLSRLQYKLSLFTCIKQGSLLTCLDQLELSVKSDVSLTVSTFQVESKKRNFISILYQCKDNFIPHFTLEVPTLDRSWKNKIFLQLEKTDKSTGFQSLIHQFYSRSPKPGQLSLLPIYVTAKQGNKKFALKNQVHQIVEHLTRKCHVL